MIVSKFGGTSVGSAENMKKVVDIITQNKEPRIVVLSAMSGTTNTLVAIAQNLREYHPQEAEFLTQQLYKKYIGVIGELYEEDEFFEKGRILIDYFFTHIRSFFEVPYSQSVEKILLAQGELISTNLFQLYLEQIGVKSKLLPALTFMRIDEKGEPDKSFIAQKLSKLLYQNKETKLFITQGFICKNYSKEIDNLERGGSDYSASLIGAAIDAEQIQIYTDIDGMHNNDPRYVDRTFSLEKISFDEAAELAYFGAKILHPQSILPAKEKNIPVLVKNTFNPEAKGTLICNCDYNDHHIKAIAAKDGITAVKIKSYRMLMAYGFLKKIFDVFDKNRTPIDMISTSEVAVSITIDQTKRLDDILTELRSYGSVEVDTDLSIICIAGNIAQNKKGITGAIFSTLENIPIRMISYGGSNYNLSFLVKTTDKVAVLNLLNKGLFKQLYPKTPTLLKQE
ncbi:aspartate kinase [Namhaeicola litoreus]|uniref:Aspartokinase n=1 Tax=Namhaeicola litoreus TaxID=1052145 RepID=A0ABW3Y5A8_9FLAO